MFDVPPSCDIAHNASWLKLAQDLRVYAREEADRLTAERKLIRPLEKQIARLRGLIYMAKRHTN